MGIAGKYEMVSSENYDGYLKAIGVSLINRTVANKAKPTMEYIDLGNNRWTQKTTTTFKNFEIIFTLDEEFDETTADDRKCKSVISLNGNTLTHRQTLKDLKAETVRVFNGDEMVTTFSSNGVTAKRVFKKVA